MLIGLMMIFFFFKPLALKQQIFVDVPIFEISSFTLYELDTDHLTTVMRGESATRYANRYEVLKMNYTDNSKNYVASMHAQNGTYANDIMVLSNGVVYNREDGLSFETKDAIYDKNTNLTHINKEFVLYKNGDRVTGSSLIYDNNSNIATAKKVKAKYNLQESKK